MNPQIPILTVSQLNDYVKGMIDASTFLSRVHIKGEITNFTNHYKTGHFYFTLKDDRSLLKVVMFASNAAISCMPNPWNRSARVRCMQPLNR